MIPMITHIGTVAVYVADQGAALKFWTDQVGFELRSERAMTESARWLEVAPPGADSALVLYPTALMDDWQARKPSVVFVVDDIEVLGAAETLPFQVAGTQDIPEEQRLLDFGALLRILGASVDQPALGLRGLLLQLH